MNNFLPIQVVATQYKQPVLDANGQTIEIKIQAMALVVNGFYLGQLRVTLS